MPKIVKEDNWKEGDQVVRGRDWDWEDQDKGSVGTIISASIPGWINVKWEDGSMNDYRIGDDYYDLYFYETSCKIRL